MGDKTASSCEPMIPNTSSKVNKISKVFFAFVISKLLNFEASVFYLPFSLILSRSCYWQESFLVNPITMFEDPAGMSHEAKFENLTIVLGSTL